MNDPVYTLEEIKRFDSKGFASVAARMVHHMLRILETEIQIHPSTEIPRQDTDLKGNPLPISVDVITLDEEGMLNIGFWSFDDKKWHFHTDTLVDPYEGGKLYKMVWMYKPESLKL